MKIETDIKGGAIIFEKYELIAYLQARVAELEQQVIELKKSIQDGIKTFGEIQDQQLKDKFEKPQTKLLSNDISNWISTNEKLPKRETPVLVLIDGECHIGEIRTEYPSYEESFHAYAYWDCPYNEGQDWDWHEITHWMPLPMAIEAKT